MESITGEVVPTSGGAEVEVEEDESEIEYLTEYEIDYTIKRKRPGDDDFVEIGFSSSGQWGELDWAAQTVVDNIRARSWATDSGMPDPATVSPVAAEQSA